MKKTLKMCLLLLLCPSLLLQGCLAKPQDGDGSPSGGKENPVDVTKYHVSETYQYTTEIEDAWLLTNLNPAYLLLANKENPLGENYEPEDLIRLDDQIITSWHQDTGLTLESKAATALSLMLSEMSVDGVTDIKVTSAYRSFERQKSLYQTYLNTEMNTISKDAYAVLGFDYIMVNYLEKDIDTLSMTDANKVVLSYSAYPGTSEHQTGLCVDFITSDMGKDLTVAFEDTEAFDWLSENAYRFGFILRYPKDKTEITGYSYEPWHYRFVGREAATDIYMGNLTLEEYLGA